MDFYNVGFAMSGQDGKPYQPAGDCKSILQLADDLLISKRFSEAIKVLEEAVEANPSLVSLHQMLTRAYIESKRIQDAKRELDRLHKRGVMDPIFSVQLAAVSLGTRRFDDAIFYFREAKTLGAMPGEWSILFGNALRHTGQIREAEEVYQDVLPICDAHRYDLFFGMSVIRLQQGRYSEAVELALHALKSKRPKTRAIYFLGLALMRMKNSEQAICAFRDFIRLEPKQYIAPYRWLERLVRKSGDDAEADAFNLKAREILENRRLLRRDRIRDQLDRPS